MADKLEFGEFKHYPRGVVEVMKSSAVQEWVRKTGESMAAKASASATARRASIPSKVRGAIEHGDPDSFDEPPYESSYKVGRYTPFAAVQVNTREGAYDQNRYHTLDSLNH